MSIEAPYVLPEDVLVFPVAQLAAELRSQLPGEAGDYAITRPQARQTSKLVDPDAAALIESFRAPRTIVDAVLAFSKARTLDAHRTLEEAFPLLCDLILAGILVPAGSERAQRIRACLEPGESCAGWTVEATVHVVEDTEVHRVRDGAGRVAALKLARPGHTDAMRPAMQHEAMLLRDLAGTAAPRLIDAGEEAGRPYVVLEWCEGVPAPALAGKLRTEGGGGSTRRLLALCIAVLRAYAELHARGVIHGDVHPNNVLAAEDGTVRVLDFGLAHRPGRDPVPPPRGGVPFYLDPAWAAAAAAETAPPPADAAAELYGLAALLRELLVGRPYLDFSADRSRMLQQIIRERPLPFIRHGARPWTEVERVLNRALAKDPAARFASVAEFADALAATERPAPNLGPDGAARSLLRSFLDRTAIDGAAYRALDDAMPLCSVNTGAAGIAYALYRIASAREDPAMLSMAELWCVRAERHAQDEAAFYDPDLDLTPETVGRVSLFHTAAGVACTQALTARALGDPVTAADATARFLARSRGECDSLDVTLGRSGTLLGCAALLAATPEDCTALREAIVALGEEARRDIEDRMSALPPIGVAQALNLGIAHGWAGVLFALLRWREASMGSGPEPAIEARLGQLAAMAQPEGEGLRWPWFAADGRVVGAMPGWCNGSGGLVHLWTLAQRRLGNPAFEELARRAAWNAWQEPRNFGDLCCGAAGRAYAMLDMYRYSGEAIWLDRARALAEDGAKAIGEWSLRRDSLYKGEVGVALLSADLERPERSAMPLFDAEV